MPRRCASNRFANLREFLVFWIDDRPNLACCLFATDEELETDPDAFDCGSCRVSEALDSLWPENRRAWTVYRQLNNRFAYETRSIPLMLDRLTRDMETDDLFDLMDRLALIFDVMNPVQVPSV